MSNSASVDQKGRLKIPMERRATERFPLKLPVTVRWTTRSGSAKVQTESHDVSSGGIYFYLPEQIEDGSPVEMVISLPHEINLDGQARVQCYGRVQRTDVIQLNRIGMAAQIEDYQFLRGWDDELSLFVAKT